MLSMPLKDRLNIHVIGAGGTGGYCVEFLARLLAGGEHKIHVYDGDMVEIKNLKRQNFAKKDVDLNKADVLCRRLYEQIMDVPELVSHPNYIANEDEFLAEILLSLEENESLIVILAVDNVSTRKMVNRVIMEKLIENRILTVALDSGNDDQGGQVVLYANGGVRNTEPLSNTSRLGLLPTMLQVFPELNAVDDKNPAVEMDCAENAESKPQAMMANVRNGEILAQIIIRLKETGKAPGNLWRSDILTGNTKTEFTGFVETAEE